MVNLTLIRGLPGSGKSTRAKVLAGKTDAVHLEGDQYYELEEDGEYFFNHKWLKDAHKRCQRLTQACLDIGRDVVVSNTFTQLWEMDVYLAMAANNLMIDVSVLTMTRMYGSIHNVPQEAIDRMEARWEDFEGEVLLT